MISATNCKKSDPDPVTSLTFVRRCRLKKAYSEFIRVLVNCHVVVVVHRPGCGWSPGADCGPAQAAQHEAGQQQPPPPTAPGQQQRHSTIPQA